MGGPVAKPPCCQCREVPGLILGWGRRSYRPQLGPPWCSEDDEDLHTAIKIRCSQINESINKKKRSDSGNGEEGITWRYFKKGFDGPLMQRMR